jgi:hypothetical protein
MDPLRAYPHPVMTAALQAEIAAIKPTPQELPSAPFSRATALWLCRTCSWWNAPERTHCKECAAVRS